MESKNLLPTARMTFKKKPEAKTPYILIHQAGQPIDFCGKYKVGKDKGQLFITMVVPPFLLKKTHEKTQFSRKPR